MRGFIFHKHFPDGSAHVGLFKAGCRRKKGYSSPMVVLVRAVVGGNKVKQFLVISSKVKCYDEQLGPYDALRLIICEDCKYRLLGYDKTLKENLIVNPLPSSCIVQSMDKLSDNSWTACLGIQGYTIYKERIGF